MGNKRYSVWSMILFALAAGCGSTSDIEATTGTGEGNAAPTAPAADAYHDTASEYCDGNGNVIVELAFQGTIRAEDLSVGVPWVTFDVADWYTDDLGTDISLWASNFDGTIGEVWLIAASRYSVDGRASGDVFWCASQLATDDLVEKWESTYGGSVVAGSGRPESEAAPEVLAEIDEAERTWQANRPDSYTATLNIYDRLMEGDRCGNGAVRVTVQDGAVIQARDLSRHCDLPLDIAPTVDGLFAIARKAAGALQGPIEYDQTYGHIRGFAAIDRAVEVDVWVDVFVPDAFPLALDPAEALSTARTLWADSNITGYTATIDVRCFCDVAGPYEVTIEDGQVAESSPQALDWAPAAVEEFFAVIESNLGADFIEVAFHPDWGYPVVARIDPDANGNDDEIDYFIHQLTPLP